MHLHSSREISSPVVYTRRKSSRMYNLIYVYLMKGLCTCCSVKHNRTSAPGNSIKLMAGMLSQIHKCCCASNRTLLCCEALFSSSQQPLPCCAIEELHWELDRAFCACFKLRKSWHRFCSDITARFLIWVLCFVSAAALLPCSWAHLSMQQQG